MTETDLALLVDQAEALLGQDAGFGDGVAQPVAFEDFPDSAAALGLGFSDAKRLWRNVFERAYLSALMHLSAGNISAAARRARMDRKYLRGLLRKHRILSRTSSHPRTQPGGPPETP